MRSKDLLRLAACAALLALGAPLPSDALGATCSASDCLTNSAAVQKLQLTGAIEDHGDGGFFTTPSGQLPNVVFVLDNSTSMYEIPFNKLPTTGAFPNADWMRSPVVGASWAATFPEGATPDLTDALSCHSNGYFETLRDPKGKPYSNSMATPYPPVDLAYSTGTLNYFNSSNYYRYVEWNSTSAGGQPPGSSGSPPISASCQGAADGKDSLGTTVNSLTPAQQKRCQQCVDEAGYYIRPNPPAGTAGVTLTLNPVNPRPLLSNIDRGIVVFKGNWLNFYPPKFLLARKVVTDFISAQATTPTPVRIGVVSYDQSAIAAKCTATNNPLTDPACSMSEPANAPGFRTGDGGHLVSAGMAPACDAKSWIVGRSPCGGQPDAPHAARRDPLQRGAIPRGRLEQHLFRRSCGQLRLCGNLGKAGIQSAGEAQPDQAAVRRLPAEFGNPHHGRRVLRR
jgi:hypothetical protein